MDSAGKHEKKSDSPPLDPEETVAMPGGMVEETSSNAQSQETLPAGPAQTIINENVAKPRIADIQTIWGETIASEELDASLSVKPRNEVSSATTTASRVILKTRTLAIENDPAKQPVSPDYRLLNILGEGGMGVVYEAHQTSVDRAIAIKRIKPSAMRDEDARVRFLSEAAVTGDLDHPNIVPVHDLGVGDDGSLFYAMKRVQGTPWKDVLDDNSLHENLEILLRVSDAMAFAHSRGVIHRDLKPDNVMLGDFGETLVMDWGLAVSVGEHGKAEPVTQSTAVGGTPCYMAPEMAMGYTEKLGPASDVYLLGAILYHLVCGYPPHSGETAMHCLLNAAENNIEPSSESGELMDIAMKAMAKEPEDRYQTVKEFQRAIRDYLRHYESLELSAKAQEDLEKARTIGAYEEFAQALYRFRESVNLWGENEEARWGISITQREYAECSLTKGDLDLAMSLLNEDDPAHSDLIPRIRKAQEGKRARQRRIRFLIASVICLVAIVLAAVSIGLHLVREEEQKTRNALLQVQKEKKQTEAERNRAMNAESKAEIAYVEAEKALALVLRERAKGMLDQKWSEKSEAELSRIQQALAVSKALSKETTGGLSDNEAKALQAASAKRHNLLPEQIVALPNSIQLRMILIPEGEFVMGSPPDEADRDSNEFLHKVSITQPFYLGATEVTVAQWREVLGLAGSTKEDARFPVSGTPWQEIQAKFLPQLQKFAPDGFRFRLPTEAEWEYACRAGARSSFYCGNSPESLEEAAWFNRNSDRQPHPVAAKTPNAWGLYDMHGNMAEWCADAFQEEYYVQGKTKDPFCTTETMRRICLRGGSWINLPKHCRSAYRSWTGRDRYYGFLGFRVACVRTDTDAVPRR